MWMMAYRGASLGLYAPKVITEKVAATRRDAGKKRRGDAGTRRRGDKSKARQLNSIFFAASPRPRVPASLLPRLSLRRFAAKVFVFDWEEIFC